MDVQSESSGDYNCPVTETTRILRSYSLTKIPFLSLTLIFLHSRNTRKKKNMLRTNYEPLPAVHVVFAERKVDVFICSYVHVVRTARTIVAVVSEHRNISAIPTLAPSVTYGRQNATAGTT